VAAIDISGIHPHIRLFFGGKPANRKQVMKQEVGIEVGSRQSECWQVVRLEAGNQNAGR
jgi:hypothetical protein